MDSAGLRILLLLVILLNVFTMCSGGRFYCRPRSALTISIGRSSHTRQPDNFVLEEDLEPELPNSTWRRCSWVLELDSLTPRQVVLRGIHRSSLTDIRQKRSISTTSMNFAFRLTGSTDGKCLSKPATPEASHKLSDTTFILRSMSVREQLTLSMDFPPEKPSVAIAVSVIEPDYCAQNMVLHNGKCHAVIEQQNSSLTDVMQIISNSSSAGMQLASFSSLEEIRNFVKQNNDPEFDIPPKQPMNLTKPVRIGLFYSRSSNSVFECIATDSRCEMKMHPRSEKFLSAAKSIDGPCGALQAENSESPAITFVSCNQRMPSLISFLQTPENATCTDCDDKIRKWLGDKDSVKLQVSLIKTEFAIVAAAVAGASLVIVIIVLFLHLRKILSQRQSGDSAKKSAPTLNENESNSLIIAPSTQLTSPSSSICSSSPESQAHI